MSDTLLKVEGLYKKFTKSLKRSMYYGTVDATKSMFGFPINNTDLRKGEFWALQDINFELKRGETLGLIGQNGCGKSTLLRLINGIFPPDRGKITINGRIGALIAVGAGFHPHMTGRENVYLNGTILGMSKHEIKRKFDEIVDFAEIGDFIDAPVATYSSGMTVRLGFAIAVHVEPDILLIDEILAVGDVSFVGKCYNKLSDLRTKGVSTILVTHNQQAIFDFCKRGILMNHGSQIINSTVNEAIKKYEDVIITDAINKEQNKNSSLLENKSFLKTRVFVQDKDSNHTDEIDASEKNYFCYEINSDLDLHDVFITFHIQTQQGVTLVHIRNDVDGLGKLKINKGYNLIKIELDKLELQGGAYKCSFVLINKNSQKPVLNIEYLKPALIVKGTKLNDCILNVNRNWILNE